MFDVNTKATKILKELLENAKEIGNKKNSPLTAERFVVAVIDKVTCNTEKTENVNEAEADELMVLGEMLRRKVGSLKSAKENLMEYICREQETAFLDDLYMKKKLERATQIAEEAEVKLVDSVSLLWCIAEEPSKPIQAIFDAPVPAAEEELDPISDDDERYVDAMDAAFGRWFKESEKRLAEMLRSGEITQEDIDEAERITKAQRSAKPDPLQLARTEMSELVSDVKRIRKELQSSVFGQDNAINVFATGYFQARMKSMLDKSGKRPSATFLFAGPPGVGKTFLAEKAAEALKLPFRRFDMSEYADKESNLEFCGSDKVYKNGKSGNVTSFVADNPKCVLLFDEIEKAHLCVIHLFLQMLDAGRLRDNYTDKEVSFSDAIIILTTNAGKQLYEDCESGDLSSASRKVVVNALRKDVNPQTKNPFFPGAICSRFASGNVVMFNHVSAHHLRSIAKKEIERLAAGFEKETGIRIQIDERVYSSLLFSEGSSADARTIKSRAVTFFNNELYELLRLITSEKVKSNLNGLDEIRIGLDLTNAKAGIPELFESAEKTCVLVFASPEIAEICRKTAPSFDFIDVQRLDDAIEIIKEKHVDFAMLDMKLGASKDSFRSLNIEDVESPARDFFKFLRLHKKGLPVYLVDDSNAALSEEEKISFIRRGVRGTLSVNENDDSFASSLDTIAENLHQQACMVNLAKQNKLITFGTAQTISEDGKNAEIRLFDFEMSVAVESEDSKNVLSSVSKPDVHFDEVIGAEDAKKELAYFVEYLKNPKKYMGSGVKPPRGVLLYGPPGTGKTMLAKAMACEADVTFIAAEGNQFLKKYVGEGSDDVHKLFKTARKYAPSILFIDEIDAIARERRGGAGSNPNGEGTLTAFLTEMDGFANDPSKPVFVLAATNFDVKPGGPKSLDPALMRRFDRRVYIDLPDREERIRFLKLKIDGNKALDISDEKVDNIAMRATGMSLAQLDSIVELALRSAIRNGSTKVTDAIFEEAFETFNGGEVKKWDASLLERVARHEAGHALLCWMSGETPSYLTIVARDNHGGYMQHADNEGKALYTKDELLAMIRTSLGGRAAEIAYYGEQGGISTGASGDLVSATNVARQIVCTYGMDDDFGLAVMNSAYDGTVSEEAMTAINRILKEQMNEAIRLVSENKEKVDVLVKELLSKNHLSGIEIEKVLSKAK